jgi:hypothetical protein
VFSERISDLQPVSANFSQKYTKIVWNVMTLFFFSEKYAKINKILTLLAKETALIPIVKYQILE